MISLSELKAYIKEQGMQGEEQIARHFQTTPAVIAMMAEKLAAKDSVRLVTAPGFSGCDECTGFCEKHAAQRAWRYVAKD